MAKAAKATTDHDEIRRWVEARGGHPAHVAVSGRKNDPGILRIDYPGFSGEETLEAIEWDEFFETFDKNKLSFLYQDSPRSRFSKLVDHQTASSKSGNGARKRTTSSKTSSRKATSAKATGSKRAATTRASTKRAKSSATTSRTSHSRART